ncbi:Coleoptile phototropism protein 1 [Sesamum angolense]|uniref:Coleoptile phototropism protein 1 n=1 Tax=Sesamum angolense TaxID=2727404 RepID=A0AAE1WKS2_9LAMI|nr:Coleoptile phototropism protein 1 [Sesamum angolense]
MQNSSPESVTLSNKLARSPSDQRWSDDADILDTDGFIKILSGIQGKGVRPDLIGSIITHYASKWLPDLAGDEPKSAVSSFQDSPESITVSWMKQKLLIETVVGILPSEKDSVPCSFLLRLLRLANMVGVGAKCLAELEKRVSWQLDRASDIEIPTHVPHCLTVAKLVDCYLAEAAVDSHLTLPEFFALACAVPSHARSSDDGLYRAVDIYLKAHPGLTKQDRKRLCTLIDSRKLSAEASLHAARNERLPVRAVIQVLLSEQTKLSKQVDWSGPLSSVRSPAVGPEGPARCMSRREMAAQQMEIKRLKEDVLRLQSQCMKMEGVIEQMLEKKREVPGGRSSWSCSV